MPLTFTQVLIGVLLAIVVDTYTKLLQLSKRGDPLETVAEQLQRLAQLSQRLVHLPGWSRRSRPALARTLAAREMSLHELQSLLVSLQCEVLYVIPLHSVHVPMSSDYTLSTWLPRHEVLFVCGVLGFLCVDTQALLSHSVGIWASL